MVKTEYSRLDYEADKKLIDRYEPARHSDIMSKLEALVETRDMSDLLYINHAGARLNFLPVESALQAVENPAYLVGIILKRTENLSSESLKLFKEEIFDIIYKRVDEVFGQRYRGAVRRVQRYEKEMFSEELKTLHSAVRSKDPDRIYNASERICIMAEDFPDSHPVIEELHKVLSNAPVSGQ